MKPTLVILAAGMGSRYGGLKQIDPVDDDGNLLIDYSVHDARRAGFENVVCIIKHSMEDDFNAVFGSRIKKQLSLTTAYQELSSLPEGFSLPARREKPWGTAHALLCAKEQVNGPFAVINADDYYGPHAYQAIYGYLTGAHAPGEYVMVGFPVENTLSDYGTVTRGVCVQNNSGYLERIEEIASIRREGGGGAYEKDGRNVILPTGVTISMNFWGFDVGVFDYLAADFPRFLERSLKENPLKCEYLLPACVHDMLQAQKVSVKVLKSADAWFGVTYKEDRPIVRDSIRKLKAKGVYPLHLWR
ncbi:MAG: NTP transferase domain-containing protein [Clostridiales bacterium]|nr:NTP transferase domain-containing protein [Clostridiales bacterium]